MSIDYGKWTFSLRDGILVLGFAAAVGGAAGWLLYDSLLLGTGAACFCLLFLPRYRQWRIDQRKRALLFQFRDLLYSLSSSISVGRSMSQALEESISFWQGTYSDQDMIMVELKNMVQRIRESNETDVMVLRDFAVRSGLADVEDFVDVYENCKGTGANLIQAVNRASTVIGDKISLERELQVLMAQKKFESRIVMASPFAVLLVLKLMSPEYLLPLTSTTHGRAVSTAALALIVLASILMERVMRFEI